MVEKAQRDAGSGSSVNWFVTEEWAVTRQRSSFHPSRAGSPVAFLAKKFKVLLTHREAGHGDTAAR